METFSTSAAPASRGLSWGVSSKVSKDAGQEKAAEPTDPSATPRTLWQLIRPNVYRHRYLLLLSLFLNTLPGLGIAFQTIAPKYLLDNILLPEALLMSDRLVRLGWLLGGWIFSAFVLRMACWYFSYRIFTDVREKVVRELRSLFFRHINNLCLRFHGRHSSGELFSYVLGSPIGAISGYYHNLVMNVPNALTAFLLSTAWIFTWDWMLTTMLLAMVAATTLIMKNAHAQLGDLHEDFQNTQAAVTGRVSDIFRGNRDVKMHAIEEQLAREFDVSAETLREQTCRRDVKMHHVNMRGEFVGHLFFVLVMALGSWRFLNKAITSGELLAYLGAYGALQGPVGLLFSLGTGHAEAKAGVRRLLRVLHTGSSTPDPASHPQTPLRRADFHLQGVTFSYGAKPVLQEIDLYVPFGQRVALVGPSGAGKSTLAKLLMRLYDPAQGSIKLGGMDLKDCRSADVRRVFGVVPQEPFFFRETVRNNLSIVHPEADEKRLRAVCELANAWEFIEKMPQGLDTLIGEGGGSLSGGQRQRLAIARAILHDPDYFVFDEATSALDSLNEKLVQEALNRILRERTAFFIAHRLSTIRDCDRILVLNHGSIVQDGTFNELATTTGLFREMVQHDRFQILEAS